MKKRMQAACIVFIVTGTIASCSFRRSEPITGKVVKTEDIHDRAGEVLYMTHCYKCHPGGEGGLGPALNNLYVPVVVKRFQVRIGLGVMPCFKKAVISREDAKMITNYMYKLHDLKS